MLLHLQCIIILLSLTTLYVNFLSDTELLSALENKPFLFITHHLATYNLTLFPLCLLREQKKLSSTEQESGVDYANKNEMDFETTAFCKTATFP